MGSKTSLIQFTPTGPRANASTRRCWQVKPCIASRPIANSPCAERPFRALFDAVTAAQGLTAIRAQAVKIQTRAFSQPPAKPLPTPSADSIYRSVGSLASNPTTQKAPDRDAIPDALSTARSQRSNASLMVSGHALTAIAH